MMMMVPGRLQPRHSAATASLWSTRGDAGWVVTGRLSRPHTQQQLRSSGSNRRMLLWCKSSDARGRGMDKGIGRRRSCRCGTTPASIGTTLASSCGLRISACGGSIRRMRYRMEQAAAVHMQHMRMPMPMPTPMTWCCSMRTGCTAMGCSGGGQHAGADDHPAAQGQHAAGGGGGGRGYGVHTGLHHIAEALDAQAAQAAAQRTQLPPQPGPSARRQHADAAAGRRHRSRRAARAWVSSRPRRGTWPSPWPWLFTSGCPMMAWPGEPRGMHACMHVGFAYTSALRGVQDADAQGMCDT